MSSSSIRLGTTSDIQLATYAQRLGIPMGNPPIIMRNQCYLPPPGRGVISNLQTTKQPGTHWVAYIQWGNCVYYEDSYGAEPIQELVDLCKVHQLRLLWNSIDHQFIQSTDCGYQSLFFLYSMTHRAPSISYPMRFVQFHRKFRGKSIRQCEQVLYSWAKKHRKQLGR